MTDWDARRVSVGTVVRLLAFYPAYDRILGRVGDLVTIIEHRPADHFGRRIFKIKVRSQAGEEWDVSYPNLGPLSALEQLALESKDEYEEEDEET